MPFLDDLRENIIAAKKLRMKTLWCKSKKDFICVKKIKEAIKRKI